MARLAITDYLQNYSFWLMDVLWPFEPAAVPVFTPIFGFSSISAPEIQAEIEEIQEGNWYLKRKVVRSGSISPMTLTRGVLPYDSDFYNWVLTGLSGNTSVVGTNLTGVNLSNIGGPSPRRDFVLIHFFARNPVGEGVAEFGPFGPIDVFPKVPALAYLLKGCVPSRYKSSSDFDANSSAISMAEVTIEPESFDRISLVSP
jgi:phage tail-like protein